MNVQVRDIEVCKDAEDIVWSQWMGRSDRYTKYCMQCHLLFGIMQWYNYLLYISFIANKGWSGCLNLTEH